MTFDTSYGPLFNLKNVKKTNWSYVQKQLQWYESQNLSVQFIQEYAKLWKSCAGIDGKVNSNYGWCVWSDQNYNQFDNVAKELLKNPQSRRAIMIYTRPSMQYDWCQNEKNDFLCTNYNAFFIRNGQLDMIYDMRSNDAIYGFFNDYAWAYHIYDKMLQYLLNAGKEYQHCEWLVNGNIIWRANSFHIYQKHFKLLQKIVKSQEL